MSSLNIVLIEISGSKDWSRWMIYHIARRRYWCKGRWRKERRDGEVWDERTKAIDEHNVARVIGNAIGTEDE